jgi:lipoprotein-anchoring transpeptidase ErfK/SrfK
MIPRAAFAVVLFALAGPGEVAAQYEPPYPPGRYRINPLPDDEYSDERAPLPPEDQPRASEPRFVEPYAPAPGGAARRPFFAPRDDDDFLPRPPGEIGTRQPPTDIIPSAPANLAALPPEDQPEHGEQELASHLRRQIVAYRTKEKPGTVVIDTQHTYLYLVLGGGRAIRYGIGVGRAGYTWSGRKRISRMAEWPDWYPPKEMIERQPFLPRMMAGGPGNPLGARALYLGNSLYRIHGTNQPSTIGKFVSSGCIRMLNADAIDLYRQVRVGTRVVVLPGRPPPQAVRR